MSNPTNPFEAMLPQAQGMTTSLNLSSGLAQYVLVHGVQDVMDDKKDNRT